MNFRAGWVRLALSGAGMLLLPLMTPRTRQHIWVLAAYFICAAVVQVAIYRDIGGRFRQLATGFIDLGVLTFFLHLLGSQSSVLVTLYMLIGMLYALALGLRNAQILAVFGSAAYVLVTLSEAYGVLPYAPDGAPWAEPPHRNVFLIAAVGFPIVFLGAVTLVGKLLEEVKSREAQLEHISQHDYLTKLSNRRHLLERIELEVARVSRGHPLVAAMIDLDRFKAVNDEHGHIRGDELLSEIARALQDATRRVDVVGRYGGDEFLVLLPDTPPANAKKVVNRLVESVRRVGLEFDSERPVTASIGVAEAVAGDDAVALLQRADKQAYEAKRAGGDRAVGL